MLLDTNHNVQIHCASCTQAYLSLGFTHLGPPWPSRSAWSLLLWSSVPRNFPFPGPMVYHDACAAAPVDVEEGCSRGGSAVPQRLLTSLAILETIPPVQLQTPSRPQRLRRLPSGVLHLLWIALLVGFSPLLTIRSSHRVMHHLVYAVSNFLNGLCITTGASQFRMAAKYSSAQPHSSAGWHEAWETHLANASCQHSMAAGSCWLLRF